MTQKFLIILTNQEDIEIKLANAEAADWINAPLQLNKSSWEEAIPLTVLAGFHTVVSIIDVTSGSAYNDRALSCPGLTFDRMSTLIKYCHKNNIELIDEFIGVLY